MLTNLGGSRERTPMLVKCVLMEFQPIRDTLRQCTEMAIVYISVQERETFHQVFLCTVQHILDDHGHQTRR